MGYFCGYKAGYYRYPDRPNTFPYGRNGDHHFSTHTYGVVFNGGGLHIGFKTNQARTSFMKYFYDKRDRYWEEFRKMR